MSSSLIVAIDYMEENAIYHFCDQISPKDCRIKIGIEVLAHLGYDIINKLQDKGFDIFLDLKLHDVPSLVTATMKHIADRGVWMTSIDITGGSNMMTRAKDALENYGKDAPKLIGVSVLGSMTEQELAEQGINENVVNYATRLNMLAKNCGLDGILCAPRDVQRFKTRIVGQDAHFKILTNGIRPIAISADDQQFVTTPKRALAAGADYLIVGRPIVLAKDPQKALKDVLKMMK